MPDIIFFPPGHLAVYEIIWKNMVQLDRLQIKILYGAWALHDGQLRLQTHTQNM
jgi:hypothetical protein